MTLDYDLSNRVSGVSHPDGTEQYRYAPDNRRVWRSAGKGACFASRGNNQEAYWGGFNGYGNTGEGPTEQLILYSPGGQKMGAYCVGFSPNMQYFAVTASEENVYYGGRLVGKRIAALSVANSGVVSAFTADRLQSKGNGSNYYPYGESKSSTAGDDREAFATYTRDEKSGLDYANQRWYSSVVGRFSTVDPNIANANANRGGSWNAYAYTEGNPVNASDPSGLAGEGCGTWWEGATDFGKCGGGGGNVGEGCLMTKAGCIDMGNGGGGELVSCVDTEPTSAFFGARTWCLAPAFIGGPPGIGGRNKEEKTESCNIEFGSESVFGPIGRHTFIRITIDTPDGQRYQAVYEGINQRPGSANSNAIPEGSSPSRANTYLNGVISSSGGLRGNYNNIHSSVSSAEYADICQRARAVDERARSYKDYNNIYRIIDGPNSNSYVHWLIIQDYFLLNRFRPPAQAVGWDKVGLINN
jgi:RHS repeat-associated protein